MKDHQHNDPLWVRITEIINDFKSQGLNDSDILSSLADYIAVKSLTISHDEREAEKRFETIVNIRDHWRANTLVFKRLIRKLEHSTEAAN